MSWKCCGLCRLALADDDERPFSERQDMEQSNGRWNWNFTTEQRGIYLRASRRVSGSGGFLGVTLRHKLGQTIYHDQAFALFWNDGYRGREKPFLYCGATMDAEDAASIICCPVSPSDPAIDSVVISISDYSPLSAVASLHVELALYDADGKEISRKSVSIPLSTSRTFNGLRVEGITFADFERIEVGVLRSPDHHCCKPVPRHQCDHYEYTSGTLNYLARPLFFVPIANTVYHYLRAETVVKTDYIDGFFWQFGLGDCCDGIRYSIQVSRGSGPNAPAAVSLIKECQHGGPVVIRQTPLPGLSSAQPPQGVVQLPINVCISHVAVRSGDPPEYYWDNGVSIVTPWGQVTWSGVFGFIDWRNDCAFNLGGLLYASLMVTDVACGGSMTFTKAQMDRCFCQAYPTPEPGISECLNVVCTGLPPKREPPDGWMVSLANLPDEFQLFDWPRPVGEPAVWCSLTTTEWTSAEGNEEAGYACGRTRNYWPEITPAMVNYVAENTSVPSGFPFWSCTVCNLRCRYLQDHPLRQIQIRIDLFVPTATPETFEGDGKWPVFALISATRGIEVPYEYQGSIEYCHCLAYSMTLLAGLAQYPFCSGTFTLTQSVWSVSDKCVKYLCREPSRCDELNLEPPNLQGVTVTLTAVNE